MTSTTGQIIEVSRNNRIARRRTRQAPHQRFRSQQNRLMTESLEARCLLDGSVVISEIMYHATSGKPQDDWVELYNRGAEPVSLLNYKFSQGVNFTFPDTTLAAGNYLVVAADVARFQANYPGVTNVVGGWTGSLSNESEDLELVDSLEVVVDETFYADSGDFAIRRSVPDERDSRFMSWEWIATHDGDGSSLEVINTGFTNDFAHNWGGSITVGGTPGRVNSIAAVDIAPVFNDVEHGPIIPTSSDEVQITAHIVDEGQTGVSAVVKYRVSTLTPGAFLEVPMYDDGLHEDGAAGDGVFTALLPAQPHDTVVEFYVRASDAGGLVRTYPAPSDDQGGQDANMLYQVDDVERNADVPLFRAIMTAPERDLFNSINNPLNHRQSDAQRHATVVSNIGGDIEFRYNVGIRYRGSDSRNTIPTNNRFNIPSDRPLDGNTQINFNTVAPQSQIAGAALWNLAGEPATNAWAARVLHNGVDRMQGGFYAQTEVANSDWANRTFPNDSNGNSYKGRRANEGEPGGQGSTLEYFGEDPTAYRSYLKVTNESERDYTDLIRWTDALNNTPDDSYLEQVSQVMDIDQWFRSMALSELTGYNEFGLLVGDATGDDWAAWRGVEDPRFLFIPYDFDTMFNVGINSGFRRAENVPALNRLLNFPGMQPRFYQAFVDIAGKLTAPNVRPHLVQMLGAVVPESNIDQIVSWLQSRATSVLNRIPQQLSVTSDLPVVGDYPQSTTGFSGTLQGLSNAVTTRRVLVAGQEAFWDERNAAWSISNLSLRPGVNRVVVQAMDADGMEIERTYIDLWSQATGTSVSGTLAGNTTWTVNNSPYTVTGELTVPVGTTLTIQPGVTVFFEQDARMLINGQLTAIGTGQQEIRFTRTPTGGGTWRGLQYRNSQQDNQLQYAVLEWGRTTDGMIGLEGSRLNIDHSTLDNTDRRRIRTIDSSLVVRNSTFTNIFEPGEAPTSDNQSEHIWGSGIPADGQFIIENNTFGTITGHNDGIDFDAPRLPAPIPHILNNRFLGGGDDALDMTGDVHIEGNTFRNYIKDQFNLDPGNSNVISSSGGDYFVFRNVFENIEHAELVKEGAFSYFINNTVINASTSALYFDFPGQTSGPGRGALVENNIFANLPAAIDLTNPPTQGLTVNYNLLTPSERNLGVGNIAGDPVINNIAQGDFSLRAGSQAIGAARNGGNLGADVLARANIAGEPAAVTRSTAATLTVGGPAITHYQYRVNGGNWSTETPVTTPISLTGLVDGTYSVEVIGKNLLGIWQDQATPTASKSWQVNAALAGLRINEILASNDSSLSHEGTFPDAIELYNAGTSPIDLAGMTITDDPAVPAKYTLPNGTSIGPGDYLVLYADAANTSGIHVGFNLNGSGEGVYLYNRAADGGALHDSVVFGLQVTDFSIGIDRDGDWTLTRPTLGAANIAVELGSPQTLKINEWLATNEILFDMDFIELYNPNPSPVLLSGLSLTDNAFRDAGRHVIAPLSFIGGRGLANFIADGDTENGPDHLTFTLNARSETIGLHDVDLSLIDVVRYAPQQNDVSEGRTPNGAESIVRFRLPNPGIDNPVTTIITSERLIDVTDVWRYVDTGVDLGTSWVNPAFDDSAWTAGPGLLYAETADLPAPKNTPITLGNITYYFRRTINIDNLDDLESVQFTTIIDDGAVMYVNGVEVARLRMPNGPIAFDTTASNTVGDASAEGPFEVPLNLLVDGENVIAVEVHQQSVGSSDVVFGLFMDATLKSTESGLSNEELLAEHLRVTEVMYNPIDGTNLEFIELQNTGSEPLELEGVRISQGVDFIFPAMILSPGQFIVVVNDRPSFETRYGTAARIAGEFSGNLANGSERIRLQLPVPYEANILDFTYDDGWYAATDSVGFSLVVADALAERDAWTMKSGWRPSHFIGGSPGLDDAGFASNVLVINEVLANSSGGEGDRIEIHNTTVAPLVVDGWYLSNDPNLLTKFRIPVGTTIPPDGYLTFSEVANFGGAFSLANHGGQVYLASSDAVGGVAGFITNVSYGAADVNVSLGRHMRSDGEADFVAQSSSTLGAANAGPQVGPIVINEIHYRPLGGTAEFIELHNSSAAPIPLYDVANPANTWRMAGGVDFIIPTGTEIPANGYLLLVNSDPVAFRAAHGVPVNVAILGPFTGSLDDAADDIRLVRPGVPDQALIPEILVDRVNYTNATPWPVHPADVNVSLNRLSASDYGNDPASWSNGVVNGTPGRQNIGVDTTAPSTPTNISGVLVDGPRVVVTWTASIDLETGIDFYRVFRDGQLVGTTTTAMYSDNGVTLPGSYQYQISAVNLQGLESPNSAPSAVQLISVESVISRQATQVEVRFTDPITPASAQNLQNFSIDQGVAVLSALLAGDGRSVTLTTSPLQLDLQYRLTVQGVASAGIGQFPSSVTVPFLYVEAIPGFSVRVVHATNQIGNLAIATALLAVPSNSPLIASEAISNPGTINYLDDDGHTSTGEFGGDLSFPGGDPGDDNEFALRASGTITVPAGQGGAWSFGVNLALPAIAEVRTQTLVRPDSVWSYSDAGVDLGTAWRAPDFDDSAWASGPAQLGYGDGDESTQLSFGGNANNKHPTYYFRTEFNLADPSAVEALFGNILRDDGVAIYLNGTEVFRDNLGAGATFRSFATQVVNGGAEQTALPFTVNTSALVAGVNVLAVEIHQSDASSSDISMALELFADINSGTISEDGARLRIDGVDVLVADVLNATNTRFGDIVLSEGTHDIELVYFEHNGPAEVELFAARGVHDSFDDTDAWRLVGDVSGGGLAVVTEPMDALELPWQATSPIGSLAYEFSDRIAVAGQGSGARYEVALSANQLFSAAAVPVSGAGATVGLSLSGPGGIVAANNATRGDAGVALQGIRVPADGVYVIEVTGDLPTDVDFYVGLNSLAEGEQGSGPANDTTATAQSLVPAMFSMGNGIQQANVRGRTDGLEYVQTRRDALLAPNVLTFDFPNIPPGLSSAVLTITAIGDLDAANEFLQFSAEGLLARNLFVDNGTAGAPNVAEITLDAATLQTLLTDGTIRFTVTPSADVSTFPNNSIELRLRSGSAGTDVYAIDVSQGEVSTFTLTTSTPDIAGVSLEILDSSGTVNAVSLSGSNTKVVRGFVAPTAGTYYVRVSGPIQTPYHLVATRGADFESLPNDSLLTAPYLPPYVALIGQVGEGPAVGEPVNDTQVNVTNPVTRVDGAGFSWDIQSNGSISDGTNDAFDGGLTAGGFTGSTVIRAEQSGREIVVGPSTVATGVSLTRKIYVSPTEGFARYLEIVTNSGPNATTYSLGINTNLGSDGGTQLVRTSSGDQVFTAGDNWIVTDDVDNAGDPTITHVMAGNGGLRPSTVGAPAGEVSYSYILALAPGETKVIMHFATQSPSSAVALTKAERLEQLELGALNGINDIELSQIANFRIGDPGDFVTIPVTTGASIQLSTQTPSSLIASLPNNLDPLLQLYDEQGNLVASDDNSAADGKNASIAYTATSTGNYRVRVSSTAQTGQYVLYVSGHDLVNRPLQIISTLPTADQNLVIFPEYYELNFSESVDASSITPSDLTINGVASEGVTFVDGDTVRFTIPASVNAGGGTYQVAIAADAMRSLAGSTLAAFTSTFVLDGIAPKIVSSLWNGAPLSSDKQLFPGILTVSFAFDETLRTATLTNQDVVLQDRNSLTTISANSVLFDTATNTASLVFLSVPEGAFRLTLVSADGAFEDIVGNNLDGEAHATNVDGTPSGDGVAGGNYSIDFLVSAPLEDLDGIMTRISPQGSLVFRHQTASTISFAGDIDGGRLHLDAGELINATLSGLSPSATYAISLVDAAGSTVARATAPADAGFVDLRNFIVPANGTYELHVSGNTIHSTYRLDLVRGAGNEWSDSSVGNPYNLSATLTAESPRWAVLGSTATANPSGLVWGVQPATGKILILDPASGRELRSFAAPDTLAPTHTNIGLSVAERGLVLLYHNADVDPNLIYRLDSLTGAVLSTSTISGGVHDGLGYAAGRLYLGRDGIDLRRQDGYSQPITDGWATGAPSGAVGGDDTGRIFIYTPADQRIHEVGIQTDTNNFLSTLSTSLTNVEGLAFDGQLLYVSSASGDVQAIAPNSGIVRSVWSVSGGGLYGLAAYTVQSPLVSELEPNNSRNQAQNIDDAFNLGSDPNITSATVIPHATIAGTGNDTYDFYRFTVPQANARVIFDIDGTTTNLDGYLRLYDSNGTLLSSSDDSTLDPGSTTGLDSFLDTVIATAGTYYIEVGSCCTSEVDSGTAYTLHVSVTGHVVGGGGEETPVSLVNTGAVWKYLDDGSNQGTAWRQPNYNDTEWESGASQLGYGDGDEVTVVGFGSDSNDKFITTYFRHEFQVADPRAITGLSLALVRDDGAALYLNGVEIVRDNLVANAAFDTLAITFISGNAENEFVTFNIPDGLLVAGRNVLAAEMHQNDVTSSDLSFDLRLSGVLTEIALEIPTFTEVDQYTIDWTNHAGETVDILLQGLAAADYANATLELLGPDGTTVLATSTTELEPGLAGREFDQVILDYQIEQAGIYFLRLSHGPTGEYSLIVTENVRFDTEPVTGADTYVIDLGTTQGAIGHVAAGGGATSIDDPADAVQSAPPIPDFASIGAVVEEGALIVTLTMHNTFTDNDNFAIYVDLDLDQNTATGAQSFQQQFGPVGQRGGPLGVERRILVGPRNVFGANATMFDLNFTALGTFPITYTPNSFRFTVPLTALAGDDGGINLSAISFNQGAQVINDAAPNDQVFVVSPSGTGSPTDIYQVHLEAGESVVISTRTPLDSHGAASVNQVDLALSIQAPDGTKFEDDNSAADGRNARVAITAPAAGDYLIHVTSINGAGEYQLLVAPALVENATVVGRHLFYNGSAFDGNGAAVDQADNQAIAADKQALLPGQRASFVNYSSYSRGINALAIDVEDLAGTPSAADFEFKVGNDNVLANWSAAPAPSSIMVLSGGGANGSDRIILLWPDNAIEQQWLQVTMLATDATGLATSDQFYFGNAIGETGNSSLHAKVDTADEIGARNNPKSFADPALIDNRYDFDRDQRVDATDQIIARNHPTTFVNELRLIIAPATNPEEVPETGGRLTGDFDDDFDLDRDDLDMLTSAILTNSTTTYFDVDYSGSLSFGDVQYWVFGMYGTLFGDTNLDRRVDATDFDRWQDNAFQETGLWSRGDFNVDGVTDVSDFNIWFTNRFQSRPDPNEAAIRHVPRAAASDSRTSDVIYVSASPAAASLAHHERALLCVIQETGATVDTDEEVSSAQTAATQPALRLMRTLPARSITRTLVARRTRTGSDPHADLPADDRFSDIVDNGLESLAAVDAYFAK